MPARKYFTEEDRLEARRASDRKRNKRRAREMTELRRQRTGKRNEQIHFAMPDPKPPDYVLRARDQHFARLANFTMTPNYEVLGDPFPWRSAMGREVA